MGGSSRVIEARDLIVKYGHVVALDGVSVRIPGGLTLIVGTNASGKTTLIKTALGILRPSSGLIRTLGLDPLRDPISLYRRVTYVSERDAINPSIRVNTHLEYLERIYGDRVWEVAEALGLAEYKHRRYKELSRGLQRRLALAEALASERPLVIVDEPLSGLDPKGRRIFGELLRDKIGKSSISMVIVSHIPIPGITPDHIVILDAGNVVYDGPYDEVVLSAWYKLC